MFKIPSYDELEKKENDQKQQSVQLKGKLFQSRKLVNLNDTCDIKSGAATSSTHQDDADNSGKKPHKHTATPVHDSPPKKQKLDQTEFDDDLLIAFIHENKDVMEKKTTTGETKNDDKDKDKDIDVFKKPQSPPNIVATKTLAPNPVSANTNINSNYGSGGALIVNSKQKGNPILKHIRNVQWKYSDTLVPDFCMSRNSCAFYLSMKYHLLNPTYVHQRVKELGRAYDLRILLAHVDVKEPRHCIKELEKISIYSNLTLILCWTPEEVGRYLETYKAYEFKSADLIMEKSTNVIDERTSYQKQPAASSADAIFLNNFTDFLCQIKSINKTDASTLRKTFGSIKEISSASKEELNLCPGLGPLKVDRLFSIFRTPFLLQKNQQWLSG